MACLSENIEREEGAREEEMNSGSSGSILKILGGQPRHFAAPMVDASELAFRMLVRRYGAHVCYTPMIHSKLFLEKKKYRKEAFNTAPGDRPLIAQLCGNDPNIVCQVAKMLENDVDAIDMNFGCPQRIAQKGFYGAFLLDHVDLMVDIVRELSKSVKVPITCKIRIVDDEEETLSIAKRLEEAGCSLLTVHGRTRKMVKGNFGPADMDIIRKIKSQLNIPVIANGNLERFEDISTSIRTSGADGVMAAEGLLSNPMLFDPSSEIAPWTRPLDLALEYLDICDTIPHKPAVGTMRGHCIRILYRFLWIHPEIRGKVATSADSEILRATVLQLKELVLNSSQENYPPTLTWYRRYRKNNSASEF